MRRAFSGDHVRVSVPLDPLIKHRIDTMVDELVAAYAQRFDRRQIEDLMADSVEQIAGAAKVFDFVPMMAFRLTRERLNALARSTAEKPEGTWDVVFVSLSGGGRGQIAAALTTLLSARRVAVHSAGTHLSGEIDPSVRAVITELGADPEDAFARPVTGEVMAGADVIVTMGHSVGVVDVPAHIRHEDWRVGDPIGAPIAEVRRVRADIEHRVRTLLADLGVPTTPPGQRPGDE